MNNIKEVRNKLKYKKNLTTYNDDELKFLQTVTGKALYLHDNTRDGGYIEPEPEIVEKRKARWDDRIICDVCNKEFTRSGRTGHNRTLYHRMKKQEHQKLKKLLIDD